MVGLFQLLDIVWGELDRKGGNSIFQVVRFSSANDRGGDNRFGGGPGESRLGHRESPRFGYRTDPLDDVDIILLRIPRFGMRLHGPLSNDR